MKRRAFLGGLFAGTLLMFLPRFRVPVVEPAPLYCGNIVVPPELLREAEYIMRRMDRITGLPQSVIDDVITGTGIMRIDWRNR